MNKIELVSAIAEKSGLSKKDSESALNATIESIVNAVSANEKVQIIGFGGFGLANRAERQGRNPKTNEPITIPAKKAPKFKAGKAFRDAVQ